ncbi:DUF397 domain-containing protein [Cryptosporangium sp. NPDC051539]|uniref:DUF397 domain-containing protein n=1 Tax=Cryptosporangium sp. NPDC051539 TaxID=3363962 RepID=UPI00379121CB
MSLSVGSGWRTSSHSADKACVEVRRDADGVSVRESRRPSAGELHFPDAVWRRFIAGVKERSGGGSPEARDRVADHR